MIGVVAHIKREAQASRLIREVRADVFNFDRKYQPDPVKACADNHIEVLKVMSCMRKPPDDQWAVVLEDDALPVPDFRRHLGLALEAAQSPLVGLYIGTGNPNGPTQAVIEPAARAADKAGIPWIVADWFISTVGYAVRSEWLSGLITGISKMDGPVDMRINRWSQDAGVETWYTAPSLVNHDDGPSVISVTGIPDYENIKLPRRAWFYGYRDSWDTDEVVRMDHPEGW